LALAELIQRDIEPTEEAARGVVIGAAVTDQVQHTTDVTGPTQPGIRLE
jgi:hypothetical protein